MADYIRSMAAGAAGLVVSSSLSKLGERAWEHTEQTIKEYKSAFTTLERNIKSLKARALDVGEEIKNAGRKKRKLVVENWLIEVKNLDEEFLKLKGQMDSNQFVTEKFFSGGQATALIARTHELVEQSHHFGELVHDVYEVKGEELLTTKVVGKAFQENLETIWKHLVEDEVLRIGIYGMGGVGKSALAKNIHNQFLEKQYCVCWVTISQVFSIKKLQDDIACFLGLNISDEHDEDKRARKLHSTLSQIDKFVLILDDVWENISLEKVGCPLGRDWILIVTSRSLQICHRIGCKKSIAVRTLDRNESWKLFKETFGEMQLTPQVEEIAELMVRECDGLPLGIITLAGRMRGATNIHVWRNALTELRKSVMGQQDMEDQVLHVLKYSFNRLDANHSGQESDNGYTTSQLCFLYCSLYSKDCKMDKGELVTKFILEELMDRRKSRKEQIDQGHAILNELENVCLLESMTDDNGVAYVKMHDLVRGMALKITQGKTMAITGQDSLKKILNEEIWAQDLEKASLMYNDISEIPDEMSPNCPKLATLLLQGNRSLKIIPDSFFSKMNGLCILNLSGCCEIKELPVSLFELDSLKALLLRHCGKLFKVPYMGKLTALKELDLSFTKMKQVPEGMEELINLKCLKLETDLRKLPRDLLPKFPYLQCLHLSSKEQAATEEIQKLKQLEEFKGRVKDVQDFNRLIGCQQSMGCSTSLSYCVIVGKGKACRLPEIRHVDYNQVVVCCDLKKVEWNDVNMLAQDIQCIEFRSCKGLTRCFLDKFQQLKMDAKSLKTLTIASCKELGCILTSEQVGEGSESPFPSIEEIKLSGLHDFMGLMISSPTAEGEGAAAPLPPPPRPVPRPVFFSLRELKIYDCKKMKNLGLPVSELENLEKISVECCAEIEEIIVQGADEDRRGQSNQAAAAICLPRLKELRLCKLPCLESIFKATMTCNSIQIIWMSECRSLKKLPLYFAPCSSSTSTVDGQPSSYSPPPALQTINLIKAEEGWWRTMHWEHSSHRDLLQPFVRYV